MLDSLMLGVNLPNKIYTDKEKKYSFLAHLI